MMFYSPWYLLLLPLVPLAGWWMWTARRHSAVMMSTTTFDKNVPVTWRQRLAWLPTALTCLTLTLLIVSLARPRDGREHTVIESEGIAIEMVVDRSGSMQAMDFQIGGERVDRLTAIKNVAGSFVLGNSTDQADEKEGRPLAGRVSDLVGLIIFAGYADAETPLTLDHSFLVSQLNATEIVDTRSEDGTAIGDAISLAIEKLTMLDERKEKKVKSKVIILLTDGENNAGEFDPLQAAELAKTLGIKVYTIGVGTKGVAPFPARHPLTGQIVMQRMEVNIDEETLMAIANMTGGKYFRATNTQSLQQIYTEIDQLEKTKVETNQFVDYQELAITPIHLGAWTIPPLIWLAMVTLVVRMILSQTLLREFA